MGGKCIYIYIFMFIILVISFFSFFFSVQRLCFLSFEDLCIFLNFLIILHGIETLSISCDTCATWDGNPCWTKYVEVGIGVSILVGMT
jgi:hypothetical protein